MIGQIFKKSPFSITEFSTSNMNSEKDKNKYFPDSWEPKVEF